MAKKFDRTREDVGNVLALEHVNVTVPDQAIATLFYVNGLGLTRDPYIDFGPFNVWINVGEQQFHLPTNEPQVLRGHIGVVVPDLDDLEARLSRVARRLGETRFAFKRLKRQMNITCPWGNAIKCYGPGEFARMKLGIPYVELNVPPDTADGIARFYNNIFKAPATSKNGICRVAIGREQQLRYRETKAHLPPYDGHHIAVYIADFSGPYQKLLERGRVTEESDQHQYRLTDIFDPDTGETLYELEHEVRSLHHPMYARHLINRNPAQTLASYTPGRDAFVP